VLAATRPDPAHERADPWRVEHLVWAVLEVLRAGPDDEGHLRQLRVSFLDH